MLKCSICGKEFADAQLDEYAAHVANCAYEKGLQQKTEEMKKINQELEEVKRAGVVYHGLKDQFKEKHPDIYKANFGDDDSKKNCSCGDDSKKCSCKEQTNEKNYDDYKLSDDEVDGLVNFMGDVFGLKFKRR